MSGRLIAIDWLRTVAILAMVVFHFGRDFEVLGLVAPGTTYGGLWDFSARAIASSFLFLAGFSLWLAHGQGMRWRAYMTRLGLLVAAAAAVSIATYFAMPSFWVRFGILHSIALCSVFGLLFLRVPWWLTILAPPAILFLGPLLKDPSFNSLWWIWSGLGTQVPPMMDYEPMIPWLSPFLAGLAFAQMGGARLLTFGPATPGPVARALAWPGKHALPIYLVHQPILIGGILAWVSMFGA